MKVLLPFLGFIFLVCFRVAAQVTIESERDKDNNVNLFATNTADMPYSVLLNFSDLQNMTTPGGGSTVVVANPGRSKVATLRPTLAGQGSNFRYSYSFARGNVFAKSKSLPAYLLPVPEGTRVEAVPINPLEKRIGKEIEGNSYRGISFNLEGTTPILAPRKGVVVSLKMDVQAKGENLSFTAEENFLELYHEDGTFTKITVLKAGSEQVKLGQQVFPGDALALSAGENYAQGPHVRISQVKTVLEKDQFFYRTFPITYMSDQGELEIQEFISLKAVHPEELVTREMSKRELKTYLEGKK
ncbi:MAG: M23 family metallopeptidase [Algoriphagus sp.]|nr:M23 family metallopeptidase [Algoriphagus sp.]